MVTKNISIKSPKDRSATTRNKSREFCLINPVCGFEFFWFLQIVV